MVFVFGIGVVDEVANKLCSNSIFALEEKQLRIADKKRNCKADGFLQEIHRVAGHEMFLCAIRNVSAQESLFRAVCFESGGKIMPDDCIHGIKNKFVDEL